MILLSVETSTGHDHLIQGPRKSYPSGGFLFPLPRCRPRDVEIRNVFPSLDPAVVEGTKDANVNPTS